MQIGPQIHDQIIDEPVDAQAGQPEEADGERHNTERPQEVLRPLIKAGEEIDGEQVEEALDDPRGPVLAPAERAGALPTVLRKRMPRTRGSWIASCSIACHEPSVEPSSMKMTSRSQAFCAATSASSANSVSRLSSSLNTGMTAERSIVISSPASGPSRTRCDTQSLRGNAGRG